MGARLPLKRRSVQYFPNLDCDNKSLSLPQPHTPIRRLRNRHHGLLLAGRAGQRLPCRQQPAARRQAPDSGLHIQPLASRLHILQQFFDLIYIARLSIHSLSSVVANMGVPGTRSSFPICHLSSETNSPSQLCFDGSARSVSPPTP